MKWWRKTWWANAPGWEYDLVRLLPPAEAMAVFSRAWRQWSQKLNSTRRGRVAVFLVMLPLLLSVWAVWFLAAALGWGNGGRVAAEVVVHLALAYPYRVALARLMAPRLKPYLRDELFLLAERGLSPRIAAVWWDALACHPDIPAHAGKLDVPTGSRS
jgi:hypothetical protein